MTKPGRQEMERRMARFKQACRGAGIRLTRQRMEIFCEVARTGDHPDAETVCRLVRKRIPTVSLDTIYRTLWLLNDLGLVTTLGSSRERTRFDANLTRHHHFVCVPCGLTRDFYSEELGDLDLPKSAKTIGRIKTTLVEARGICRGCAAKKAPKKK